MTDRKYRPIYIGDRWATSEFQYYSDIVKNWRRVNNWDTREKLFLKELSCSV